jgi:hypothetical protein
VGFFRANPAMRYRVSKRDSWETNVAGAKRVGYECFSGSLLSDLFAKGEVFQLRDHAALATRRDPRDLLGTV